MIPVPKFDVCPDLVLWEDRKDELYKMLPVSVRTRSWEMMEKPISVSTSRVELAIKNTMERRV